MQGVIVLGEVCEGTLFIEAVEFPDGTKRTTHFVESYGNSYIGAVPVKKYVVYFDDDIKTAVNLYKKQDSTWYLDV